MSFKAGDRVEVRVGPDHGGGYSVVTGTVSQFKDNENLGYCGVLLDWPVNGRLKYLIEIEDCTPHQEGGRLGLNRSKITKNRKDALINQSNGRCFYCGIGVVKYFDAEKGEEDIIFNVDHKVPLSQGGTNRKENLVCSCRKCNLSKGRLTVEEFRVKRQKENDPEDRACIPLVFAGEVES